MIRWSNGQQTRLLSGLEVGSNRQQLRGRRKIYSEHSSQRAKRVANNVSSYGRDMVQNRIGFMHSVSLKSHGPVLLSMKLLPYPVIRAVSRRH